MATRSFFSHFKNFALRLLTIPLSGIVYLTTALPVHAQQEWSEECKYTTGNGFEVATFRGIECLIANVLSVAMTFIGLAAFVMLIYGAFLYMTSGGSSKGTDAGKQALTYAVIGIIVGLMSFWILQLISSFTGVRGILEFNLSL
jgi:hypothetical protein